MRIEQLIESQPSILELNRAEAAALNRAGRRLASKKSWWGADDSEDKDRSIIRCRPTSSDKWQVRVQDAVGIVSVGHLQLVVQPKIPQTHLLYLLAAGKHIPRMDDERGYAASGKSLWRLVAQWYVTAAERVLRRDLLRDYSVNCADRRTSFYNYIVASEYRKKLRRSKTVAAQSLEVLDRTAQKIFKMQ